MTEGVTMRTLFYFAMFACTFAITVAALNLTGGAKQAATPKQAMLVLVKSARRLNKSRWPDWRLIHDTVSHYLPRWQCKNVHLPIWLVKV